MFGITPATCIWVWYASDKNFVELRVIAGRSRTQVVSPQAISRRPCCAVVLRRMAWSGMAWARHGKCESDTAALCKSNGKDTFYTLSGTAWQGNGMGAAWERHAMCESSLRASQLVKTFLTFYGTRRFIFVFTIAHHLSSYWTRSIQSMPPSHFLKIHFIILASTPRSS